MNLLRKYYDTELVDKLNSGGGIPDEVRVVKCPDCFGDGIETCHNPDHGFLGSIMSMIGANESACPCCGHNPEHKMKGKCETCSGEGLVSFEKYEKYIDEFVTMEDRDLVNEHCIAKHIVSKDEEISRLKEENERLRVLLTKLRNNYLYETDEEGTPKALLSEMLDLWNDVNIELIPPPPKTKSK